MRRRSTSCLPRYDSTHHMRARSGSTRGSASGTRTLATSAGGLAAVLAPASERARAAVAIDRDDPWTRLALGFSHMLRREHEDAVEELRAALDLNPNFALGHSCLGLALAYGGKGAQAVVHLETAMRLSPRDRSSQFSSACAASPIIWQGTTRRGSIAGAGLCARALKSRPTGARSLSRPRCWAIWRRRKKPWRRRGSSSPTTQSPGWMRVPFSSSGGSRSLLPHSPRGRTAGTIIFEPAGKCCPILPRSEISPARKAFADRI